MTFNILLSEKATAKLLSFLSSDDELDNEGISLQHPDLGEKTLALDTFKDFRAEGDLGIQIFAAGSLLGIILRIVSGQASRFGIYDFSSKGWLLQMDFPAQEVIAGYFHPNMESFYLGSWIYRFNESSIYLMEKYCFYNGEEVRELEKVGIDEKALSEKDEPSIELATQQRLVFLHWGRRIHKFKDA